MGLALIRNSRSIKVPGASEVRRCSNSVTFQRKKEESGARGRKGKQGPPTYRVAREIIKADNDLSIHGDLSSGIHESNSPGRASPPLVVALPRIFRATSK